MRISLSVVRPFDPWQNPLCTCPFKYGLNPYTGCGHGCLYCYITSYIPNAFNPRPKEGLLEKVRRDLEKIPRGAVVALSNSSDPYTPPEAQLGLTRRVLQTLLEGLQSGHNDEVAAGFERPRHPTAPQRRGGGANHRDDAEGGAGGRAGAQGAEAGGEDRGG